MEHRWRAETRTKHTSDKVGGTRDVDRFRYVCTCGHVTRWYRNVRLAQARRDAHALEGQTSLDL